MKRAFREGQRVQHYIFGRGIVGSSVSPEEVAVMFDDTGHRVVTVSNLVADDPSWSEVRPDDTVEFDVQGDKIKVKAQGTEGQPTVLGWKVTEVDGVWNLLSIKKRNPPVPTRFGARVMYRDKQWTLIYSVMVPGMGSTKHRMVWVEINENQFNWVGHDDIDRETFEVIFDGWVAL